LKKKKTGFYELLLGYSKGAENRVGVGHRETLHLRLSNLFGSAKHWGIISIFFSFHCVVQLGLKFQIFLLHPLKLLGCVAACINLLRTLGMEVVLYKQV
jgi:hypothetical protein